MTSNYDALILQGERTRETGNPHEAIEIFQQALELATRKTQEATALRHIGLCYEHLGELDKALEYYQRALALAIEDNDLGDMARTKRHMLSVELKKGNISTALAFGKEARNHMLELDPPPTDLIWVTHGLVKVLIDGKYPKAVIRKWARIEWHELKYMWSIEKNQIRRRVWTTGWMMDAATAWSPWAWPLKPMAFFIAVVSGLRLRIRQMVSGKR